MQLHGREVSVRSVVVVVADALLDVLRGPHRGSLQAHALLRGGRAFTPEVIDHLALLRIEDVLPEELRDSHSSGQERHRTDSLPTPAAVGGGGDRHDKQHRTGAANYPRRCVSMGAATRTPQLARVTRIAPAGQGVEVTMDMVNEFALNGGDGEPAGLKRLKVAVSMATYTRLKEALRRITRPLPAVLPGYAALADRQSVDPWANVAPLPELELPRARVYSLVRAGIGPGSPAGSIGHAATQRSKYAGPGGRGRR